MFALFLIVGIGCFVTDMPNSPTTIVASWNFHTASRGDDGDLLTYVSMMRYGLIREDMRASASAKVCSC